MLLGAAKYNRFFNACRTIVALSFFVIFGYAFYSQIMAQPAKAAQAPAIITYQGKVLVNSLSASSSLSMIFSLYNASSGGSVVYTASGTIGTPAALSVTPTSGIFTVNLGDTGTNSIDPTIFQNNGTLFLQVTIGGQALSPRKQITAAPYAFNAKYLDGVAATTVSSSTYIPVSDATGNFNFNHITSTGGTFTGVSTFSGSTTFTTTTISSSTISQANILTLNVSGNSILTNATTTNLGITGSLNVTGASVTGLDISSLSGINALAYLANTQAFTGLNTFNATTTLATTTINNRLGIGTGASAPEFALSLTGDGSIIAKGGTYAQVSAAPVGDTLTTSGDGARMMWYARKAAFRAGVVDNSVWNDVNIGVGSAAFGYNNEASGVHAFASGRANVVQGGVGTALGYLNTVSPLSNYGTAFGYANTVSDNYAVAFGSVNTASGYNATAFGYNNTASGQYAIAFGQKMTVSGASSVGIGLDDTVRTVSQSSTLAIMGGNVGVGTTTPQGKLHVYDGTLLVDSPVNPTLKGTYDTAGNSNDVYVSGKYAYVADMDSGLQILNIDDPSNPTLVGTYNTSDSARDVYVSGKYAYVADTFSGLHIIDISNPANPVLAGTYNTDGTAYGVYVSGKYAYVADSTSGLHVIDISNPANPVLTATYNTTGNAYGVYVSGKYAYVADGGFGLHIIDISDPANPVLAGTYDTLGDAFDVRVSGKYAYVADYGSGLHIINISSSTNPVSVSTYDITGFAMDIYLSGKYAYVIDEGSGFRIIDISSSTNPFLVSTYTASGAFGVHVSGKYAYVASDTGGLRIFDSKGADINVANIGNLATSDLTVWENVDVGNSINVRNSLNVGMGGIMADGLIAAQRISVATGTANSPALFFNSNTTTGVWSSAANTFNISTGGSERLRIDSNGYIGLGTSAPTEKFTLLNGNFAVGDGSTTSTLKKDTLMVGATSAAGDGMFLVNSTGNVSASGTLAAALGSSNAPAFTFINDSNTGVWSSGADVVNISTGGSEHVRVNASGYVGIGTVSPQGKLHVAGGNFLLDTPTPTVITSSNAVTSSVAMAISGNYAYIGGSSMFKVVDISNPLSPTVISTTTLGASPASMNVLGNFLYIGGLESSVYMSAYDISNPRIPVFISSIGGGTNCAGAAVAGRYLYCTRPGGGVDSTGIQIVDIAVPQSLVVVTGTAVVINTITNAIAVNGRYLYVGSNSPVAVSAVDVFDPSAPVLMSGLNQGFTPVSLYASGKHVYVIDSSRLFVVDVSNPSSIINMSTTTIGSTLRNVVVAGKYAYVMGSNGITIVDITSATAPVIISSSNTNLSDVYNLAFSGRYGIAADNSATNGLRIVDLQGADIDSATIGNIATGQLTVANTADFRTINVQNTLNVGGGIYSNGSIVAYASSSINSSANAIAAAYFISQGPSTTVAIFDRRNADGSFLSLRRNGTEQGSITVTGATVSYNAFTGSHYAALPAGVSDMQQGMLMTFTDVNQRFHDDQNSEIIYGVTSTARANDSKVLGSYLSLQTPGSYSKDNPHLIMAVGNGEMWVSDNGQNIDSGDYLISSVVAGHAMKDVGDFDFSYIIGRTGESVDWSTVTSTIDGVKHAKISVLYENFIRDNRLTKTFTIDTASTTVALGTASTSYSLKLTRSLSFTDAVLNSVSFASTGAFNSLVSDQDATKAFTFNAANFTQSANTSIVSFKTQGVPVLNIQSNGDLLTNGTVKASQFITGTSTLDLAETYPVDQSCNASNNCPEAGDTVCLVEGQVATIEKCSLPYSEKAIGIVSTKPGFTLGDASDSSQRKIALAGRVPVKVSTMNGQIKVGDRLTTSGVPGVAMKAADNGPTIGVALADYYATGDGTVMAFVKMGWWSPLNMVGPGAQTANGVTLANLAGAVINVLKNIGVTIENGVVKASQFIADKVTSGQVDTQKLCVDSVCVTKDQFKDLLDKNNIAPSASNNIPMVMPTVTSTVSTTTTEVVSTPVTTTSTEPVVSPEVTASSTPVQEPILASPIPTTESVPVTTPDPALSGPVTVPDVTTEPIVSNSSVEPAPADTAVPIKSTPTPVTTPVIVEASAPEVVSPPVIAPPAAESTPTP